MNSKFSGAMVLATKDCQDYKLAAVENYADVILIQDGDNILVKKDRTGVFAGQKEVDSKTRPPTLIFARTFDLE